MSHDDHDLEERIRANLRDRARWVPLRNPSRPARRPELAPSTGRRAGRAAAAGLLAAAGIFAAVLLVPHAPRPTTVQVGRRPSPTTSPPPAARTTSTSTTSTTAPPPTSTTTSTPGACTSHDLALTFTAESPAAGSVLGHFYLSNRSSQPCTLDGYATLGAVGPNGNAVGLTTHPGGTSLTAGRAARVALAPGQSASFSAEWNEIDSTCPSITTIDVIPPNATGALSTPNNAQPPVGTSFDPCGSPRPVIDVSPLAPTSASSTSTTS